MKVRTSILACSWVLLAAVGCGDDDGDGVSTGLPSNKELSSLSDEETMQMCNRTAEAFDDLVTQSDLERIACSGAAVMSILSESGGDADSSDIPMCEEITDECIESGAVDPDDVKLTIVADCDNVTTESSFGDCDATVGDYERCASRVASLVSMQLKRLSCDLLENPDDIEEATQLDIDVENESACTNIRTKCPDVDLTTDG